MLTTETQAKEFKRVIEDFEVLRLVQRGFLFADWAVFNRDRPTATQTGQVVLLRSCQTVQRLTTGQASGLNHSFDFESFESAVDSS